MSRSRNPPPRGQGAARAKQMGLLLDLSPDGRMDDEGNDDDLEAELMNLVGGGGGRSQGKKGETRAPVHMDEIARMAALCMKDLDDEEIGDEDLDDEDLLAELNEVLEDDEEQGPSPAAVSAPALKASTISHSAPPPAPSAATGVNRAYWSALTVTKLPFPMRRLQGRAAKSDDMNAD